MFFIEMQKSYVYLCSYVNNQKETVLVNKWKTIIEKLVWEATLLWDILHSREKRVALHEFSCTKWYTIQKLNAIQWING